MPLLIGKSFWKKYEGSISWERVRLGRVNGHFFNHLGYKSVMICSAEISSVEIQREWGEKDQFGMDEGVKHIQFYHDLTMISKEAVAHWFVTKLNLAINKQKKILLWKFEVPVVQNFSLNGGKISETQLWCVPCSHK